MMKKMSLRMRLTLITSLLLILVCVVITLCSIYNANHISFAEPFKALKANGYNIDCYRAAFHAFTNTSFQVMGTVILIGSILMYILAGLALKPVQKLADEIKTMDSGTLSKRITNYSAGDELNKLADSFNGLLNRLQMAFEREKRFSAAAAHELKIPLTVIKTDLDVLEIDGKPSRDEYRESITIVRKQTNRMISLVDSLMRLSMANNCIRNDIIKIGSVLEEIVEELQENIKKKEIVLQTEITSCMISGNNVMLKHALSNLVENAIKYNVQGGKIYILTQMEQNNCKIIIRDSGLGIEKEASEHIFESFYREDQSRSRAMGGAGLGLAITKEIIEQHGGSICYSTNFPHGSVFTVRLPLHNLKG